MIQKKFLNESTIDGQFEKAMDNSFNIHNTSMYDLTGDKIISVYDLLTNKYYWLIEKNCIKITLSDDELTKYKYRPKIFANDKYDMPDLWRIVMVINNMTSRTQFNKKHIKSLSPSIIAKLKNILLYEEEKVRANKIDIEKRLKEILKV